MRQGATPDREAARKRLDVIAALCALFLVLGPLIVSRIGQPGVLNPGMGVNTFFEQYRRHEPVFLALLAAFAIVAAVMARRALPDESRDRAPFASADAWGSRRLVLVSVIVFSLTLAGTWAVMHALPLSMDEYVAAFQSRVFATGRLAAIIPEAWRTFGSSLTPVYVAYDPAQHTWMSQYLPVYSALRAPFVAVGADPLVNPGLAAVSLPLLYASARKLWPDEQWRAWLAVVFLASSSQFLFMSMTGYAMPAHLAVNLLWLYAFLRQDRAGWIAAPLVGAFALGLHNPFPHALFVTPFLLYVVMRRRWGWSAYFATVYLAGIVGWSLWARTAQMGGGGGSLLGLFQSPGLMMVAVQGLSLTLVLSWQTPVLAMALLLSAMTWRSLATLERLLAAGIVLSFGFFLSFPSTQGHGWGYRYIYSVLGNVALLGVTGVGAMQRVLGGMLVRRIVIASLASSVAVQLPVRAWQIEHYVRPFARVHDYVAHIDADVVIVDPTTSWYGIDLVRNDPFLRHQPKVLSAFYLRPADKRMLATRFRDRVHLLTPPEIAQFGIPTFPSRSSRPVWPP